MNISSIKVWSSQLPISPWILRLMPKQQTRTWPWYQSSQGDGILKLDFSSWYAAHICSFGNGRLCHRSQKGLAQLLKRINLGQICYCILFPEKGNLKLLPKQLIGTLTQYHSGQGGVDGKLILSSLFATKCFSCRRGCLRHKCKLGPFRIWQGPRL